jgi:hypothetical protein
MKLSKKVEGKTTVRLSWCKRKWVMAPTGAGREDETGKEKQAARRREYRKGFLIYRI